MPADLPTLFERVVEVERTLASTRPGRDGRDGRDGIDGEPGTPGDRGSRGERGADGKSVDPAVIAELITKVVADIPPAKDGLPGKDADPDVVREFVQQAVDAIPKPIDGTDGINGKDGTRGPRGFKGDKGDKGEQGDLGPMPEHEWDGTKLRFEEKPGEWGQYVDLRGPRGPRTGGGYIGGGGSGGTGTGADGATGPAGPVGPAGPAGSGGDLYYKHDQMSASASWVVTHNLGKFPSVAVVDSAGSNCEGGVAYDSLNQVTLTFSAAFAGLAFLN